MRVKVRGAGRDGKPIAAQVELPSTARVGDTFILGLGGEEQEEVEILGMERDRGPDGELITTVRVGPVPDYGWSDAPGKRS